MSRPSVVPIPQPDAMAISDTVNPFIRGQVLASLLAGAWRSSPPRFAMSREVLPAVLPQLLKLGVGPLAWWKLRQEEGDQGMAFSRLEQEARICRLASFVCECQLADLLDELRYWGVQPLVSKGWTVARRYPEPGLRSPRDLTLHVDPSRLEEAQRVLAEPVHASAACWVRLQAGTPELPDRTPADLYRHAPRDWLRDVAIRSLGAEDQLRLLCVDFVTQGGSWPLWLCDIGVILESLPRGFDWDYFHSGDPRRSWWAGTVIGLTARLLQARTDAVPDHAAVVRQGDWLDQVILNRWGRDEADNGPMVSLMSLADSPGPS